MMKQNHILSVFLLCSILLLAACSPAATPTVDANTIITQAAQTAAVQLTLTAAAAPATAAPTNPPLPTDTLAAPVEQPTPPPADTPVPAPTVAPTNPPSANTQDGGSFVEDVTIPDGTGAAPGVKFDKIWRIKNTGKTTWDAAYALVPIDGDHMGSPDSIPMPKDVRPGDTVDITVTLTAPTKPGVYQTFFRMRNASGQFFRLDQTGDLWIKISVGGNTATPDLTATAGATPVLETPTATSTSTP